MHQHGFRFRNNVTDANLNSGVIIQGTTGGQVANNTTRNNGQAGISAFSCSGAPTIDHPQQRLAQYHGGLPVGRIGRAHLPDQQLRDRDPGRRLGLIA
jgi:hypothetical protein